MRIVIALGLTFVAACSSGGRHGITTGNNDGSTSKTDGSSVTTTDGSTDNETALVYAHSAGTLYSVDPDTLTVTKIADFGWPSGKDEMTDIALDKSGNMTGISEGSIYSVDPTTGACKLLSDFSGDGFNGLSYISADQTATGTEILVGANTSGDLYQIDPSTGKQTKLGSYGSGWGSSGDLVSVEGATYATVTNGSGHDRLAKIDATTGAATIIGQTSVDNIFGLAYWKSTVYGFTDADGMVTIDITTGKSTAAPSGSNVAWYGAGVTTSAPVTIN